MRTTIQKWCAILLISAGFGLFHYGIGLIVFGILTLLDAVTPDVRAN